LNVEVWGTRIPYKGKPHNLAVVRDITALKLLHSKLKEEIKEKELLSKKLIQSFDWNARQISRELHDNIGQTLTSIKMDLEIILEKLGQNDFLLQESLNITKHRTIKAIKEIKDINYLLRPNEFDTLNLVSSLRNFFANIKKNRKIEIHFFSQGVPGKLNRTKAFAIHRIVQEALTNIIKHAHANKVFVHLYKKEKCIILTIEDNGVGFDLKKANESEIRGKKLGLHIMRHRVLDLEGHFSVESSIGKGALLIIEIPVE